MTPDEYFMQQALVEAQSAADEGEIPVGAVVVAGGRIIGRGHNQTERLRDVTAHAEMIALTAASQAMGGKYLSGCSLYVTVEPCIMCAGAIGWAQVSRIVIGTGDSRRGYTSVTRDDATPFHPKAELVTGVLEDRCRHLMQDFFRRRRNKPGIK